LPNRGLIESFEGLNSSVSQSTCKLASCKVVWK